MAATYTVTRTRVVQAPPERVYPLLADFRAWARWSPWEDLDPGMRRTFTGPDAGLGAAYAWSGNRRAGAGSMRVTEAEEPQRLAVDIAFEKPFPSRSTATFALRPLAGGTEVTWRMVGPRPMLLRLLGPVLAPVFSLERLVGRDFDRGLDRLALAVREG